MRVPFSVSTCTAPRTRRWLEHNAGVSARGVHLRNDAYYAASKLMVAKSHKCRGVGVALPRSLGARFISPIRADLATSTGPTEEISLERRANESVSMPWWSMLSEVHQRLNGQPIEPCELRRYPEHLKLKFGARPMRVNVKLRSPLGDVFPKVITGCAFMFLAHMCFRVPARKHSIEI